MTQSTPTESPLLTIAELARNLGLPESTTRYYCNRFAAHLPSVGEGRRRRYKPEAFEKLKTIAHAMRRDKNAYAVDLALRTEQDGVPSPIAAPQSFMQTQTPFAEQMLSFMESQTKALQEIAGAVNVFAERLPLAPAAPHKRGAASPSDPEYNGDAENLRQEIAALREQVRASESVHQNDLEQLRKWLARLGEAVANK